VQRTPHEAKAV